MGPIDMVWKRLAHNPAVVRPLPNKHHRGSVWNQIGLAPRDPIISINQLYQQDPNPNKVNLSIGTYSDEQKKCYRFSSVRKAEELIYSQSSTFDKEYSPMEGMPHFCRLAHELIFGNDQMWSTSVNVQTLAGTGALDLGAAFLSQFYPGRKEVFISKPSWINHYLIFSNYHFNVKAFRYYNNSQQCFDADGFFEDIEKLPDHSVIIFQPCGHNPASVHPSRDQWKETSNIIRHKRILPFFDIAYHGLCSGNISQDVYPIRQFAEDGHLMLVSQSFSKNMGLYGDRVGSLSILCDSEDEAYRVRSQLKNIIISKYICPPSQTSRVVESVLQDPTLRAEWTCELENISRRLSFLRTELRRKLETLCPTRQWQHITKQSGIFWYSGLTSAQVETLINEYSIYLCEDGRVNVAGINQQNIDLLATVIRDVVA